MPPNINDPQNPFKWESPFGNIAQTLFQSSAFQELLNYPYAFLPDIRETLNNIIGELVSPFLQINPFEGLTDYFHEFAERYKITEEEATAILRKYKWIIGPSLSIDFVYSVIEIGKQNGNQHNAINQLFIDYLTGDKCQNLTGIVDNWKTNPLYKPRMKIFRDCVGALQMRNRNFNPANLVIPTLIAQIDAILLDYMRSKGISKSDKEWRRKLRELTGNGLSSELANDLLLEILFQKAYPGLPLNIPTTFNRHKILHGENTRYGRIDNALRAFLLLDFLADL